MSVAVEFKNVDIVFGKEQQAALKMIDAGASRAEILDATGAVLGCAGASLAVEQDPQLKETVLRGMGELHLRLVLERIKDEFGLELKTRPPLPITGGT